MGFYLLLPWVTVLSLDLTEHLNYYAPTLKVNVYEVKTHFSEYLAKLSQEESILICKRNVPVAELRSISSATSSPRPIGLAKGQFKISEAFFDDLTEW